MPGPVGTYEAVFGESPNRGNNINVSKVDTPSPSIGSSNNKSFASFLGLVGSIISGLINYSSAQNTNRHNEELARKQNAWNREQWRLETAYNSPLAQMERLRQAGLNPGLVYGNGIENLAAASPEMVSSQGQAPSFGNPFSNFAQNALIDSQIDLNESAAEKNRASAGLLTIQSKHGELKFEIDQKYLDTQTMLAIDKAGQEFKNLQKVFDSLSADIALKNLDMERLRKYINEQMPAEIRKLAADAQLSENQANDIVATFVYRVALLKAQANKANNEAAYAKAQADYQTALNNIPGYYQSIADGIQLDNQGKLVSQKISIGNNRVAYKVGHNYLTGVDDPSEESDWDRTLFTTGEIFSVIGKIFGVHFSN